MSDIALSFGIQSSLIHLFARVSQTNRDRTRLRTGWFDRRAAGKERAVSHIDVGSWSYFAKELRERIGKVGIRR